jgi:transmembrane sensor
MTGKFDTGDGAGTDIGAGDESERVIAEQAAFWLLTLQSEELTADQRAELVQWLCGSSRHVAALFRMCRLQRDLSRFRKWRLIARIDASAPSKIMRLVPRARASDALPRARPPRAAAVAAGLAAACVAAWLLIAPPGQQEFSTQAGERREITLVDGSVMDLSPDTAVAVRYRRHERLIDLEHGEALFHVAKNRDRPFIVESASTRVRAVGTVFRVSRTTRDVCVTVMEGLVAVSEAPRGWRAHVGTQPPVPLLSLAANEQVSVDFAGVASPVRWVETSAETAAAADQLLIRDQTVAEIARRFNLRNRLQIEVSDSSLAARRISGIFRADDPQSFVAFLQVAADVQVLHRDSTHLLLGPTAGSGGSRPH